MLEDRGALNPATPEPPSSSPFLAIPAPEPQSKDQGEAGGEGRSELDLSAALSETGDGAAGGGDSGPSASAGLEGAGEKGGRRRWISPVRFDWLKVPAIIDRPVYHKHQGCLRGGKIWCGLSL